MNSDPRYGVICKIIEEARPAVQADGGDLELVAIQGVRVRVKLKGKCTSCSLAGQTLGGLRRKLMAALDQPIFVVPAQDD